jgi:hypothetical protein
LIACAAAPCLADPAAARSDAADTLPDDARATIGRPKVTLDRLAFGPGVPRDPAWTQHLEQVLRREARRADWGAGRGAHIEYRFTITELSMRVQGRVLHVSCTAFGKLPKGRTAKSRLSFGGDAVHRNQVVDHVLEIVARGVVTRLAELERVRRGENDRSRVRPPAPDQVD